MIARTFGTLVLCGAALGAAAPVMAWGPMAQRSIASTSLGLLSKESNTPFNRYQKELQEGASLSDESIAKLNADYVSDPVRAIESEMYLLQAVGPQRVDAYFVYRMGALAKMVSTAVEPLQGVDPNYRNLYFADAEGAMGRAQLAPSKRELVDPRAYFERRVRESRVNNDVIVREYQAGVGFKGVASLQLGRDASRAVSSVADVWYTILAGASAKGTVSPAHLAAYVEDAYAFYIARANNTEIDAADKRLSAVLPKTADMSVVIGDLYYKADMYERAMKEYTDAMALAPERRDVMEKISDYYMKLGQKAEEAGKLEDAEENFAKAAAANRLHPSAEAARIHIATLIKERDERHAANQAALEQANGFISLSEQESNSSHFAEAAVLLRQAADTFATVTDEFAMEREKAAQGMRLVSSRLENIKGALVDNAQSFSGSGFALDARALAESRGKGLDQAALKALMQQEYSRQIDALQKRVEPGMSGK